MSNCKTIDSVNLIRRFYVFTFKQTCLVTNATPHHGSAKRCSENIDALYFQYSYGLQILKNYCMALCLFWFMIRFITLFKQLWVQKKLFKIQLIYSDMLNYKTWYCNYKAITISKLLWVTVCDPVSYAIILTE